MSSEGAAPAPAAGVGDLLPLLRPHRRPLLAAAALSLVAAGAGRPDPAAGAGGRLLRLPGRHGGPAWGVPDRAGRRTGTDVRDLPRAALRARLGYVEQEAPVLAGSVRENLLLAPDSTDDQLWAVLADVGLTGVVRRSPRGLDVPVGDEGVLLSGGERQRLAIARPLLARPALLLLDEPDREPGRPQRAAAARHPGRGFGRPGAPGRRPPAVHRP